MSYQRDFRRRVALGVVGVGMQCYRNILPVLNHLPVRLVAVCDRDGERAALTASQYGVPHYEQAGDMYANEQLDAVILCVGPDQHPPLAVEAFSAGLDVWMEKPPAARVLGVQEMLAARGAHTCVVGFKKTFMPAARKAVEIIDSHGGREAIRSLLVTYPLSVPAGRERGLAQPDEGDWLGDGCHPLSLMLELGGPACAVTVIRGARGGGACVLEFTSGAVGNLHLAEGTPQTQPFESYRVFGRDWRVDIENSSRVRFQRGTEFDYDNMTTFAPPGFEHGAIVWEAQSSLASLENKAMFVQGFYNELRHFCDCVLEGASPTCGTLEQALAVTQIYEAAMDSMGDRVELPPADRSVT